MGSRKNYPEEFKVEAVRLVQSSEGNVIAVARDLGVSVSALRSWIHKAHASESAHSSTGLSPSDKQELARLRKEVAVLKMERDILKKAAAFFAKESR